MLNGRTGDLGQRGHGSFYIVSSVILCLFFLVSRRLGTTIYFKCFDNLDISSTQVRFGVSFYRSCLVFSSCNHLRLIGLENEQNTVRDEPISELYVVDYTFRGGQFFLFFTSFKTSMV